MNKEKEILVDSGLSNTYGEVVFGKDNETGQCYMYLDNWDKCNKVCISKDLFNEARRWFSNKESNEN